MENLHIQKDNPKIIQAFGKEGLEYKTLCTATVGVPKFSFCDESHPKHSKKQKQKQKEKTAENMEPLMVNKKRNLTGEFRCCRPTWQDCVTER